jgi:hypothetical protein
MTRRAPSPSTRPSLLPITFPRMRPAGSRGDASTTTVPSTSGLLAHRHPPVSSPPTESRGHTTSSPQRGLLTQLSFAAMGEWQCPERREGASTVSEHTALTPTDHVSANAPGRPEGSRERDDKAVRREALSSPALGPPPRRPSAPLARWARSTGRLRPWGLTRWLARAACAAVTNCLVGARSPCRCRGRNRPAPCSARRA